MKISQCQKCKIDPVVTEETRTFVISCGGSCGQSLRLWNDGTLDETILMWNNLQHKLGPMTADDFALAKLLFTTACEASSWAATARERLDHALASEMGALMVRSQVTLRMVCGRHFDQIGDGDLDVANPAPWTQLPFSKRAA